jgi:gliding motility-associated-like protein
MRLLYFIIILCFTSSVSFSQGEANIWYFGENAGLDFNSGNPVALTDGQLNTQEGCATICNSSGQLLFYTDGITVWNRNHQIMPNGTGLFGHPSSTHSATIVPLPGSSTLFYVFTLDAFVGINGFCYSIVDMSLNGGFGAVTTKNIQLYTPSNEKLSVVKHANNSDFWVVTRQWSSNNFVSYLLTSSGVSSTPIISSAGALISGATDNVLGQMKISPNGSKIALCNLNDNVELFDFNTNTGVVSNAIQLYNADKSYGVEFSPNSQLLYVSNLNQLIDVYKILQFQVNAPNVPSSLQTIYSINQTNADFWAMQLGPDGKIYVTEAQEESLAVIQNPNQVGIGCNFQANAISLAGRTCKLGLPPFVSSFLFNAAFQLQNTCVGVPATFQLNNTAIIGAVWNFGDGTTSTVLNPSHTYGNPGNYTVSVVVTTPNGTGSNTRQITIYPKPTLTNSAVSLKQCDDNNDGFSAFNLSEANELVVASTTGLTFSYFETQLEAQSNSNPISNFTAYSNQTVSTDQVFVRVENANGCYRVATVNLIVSTTLIPSTFHRVFRECDTIISGSNSDGIATFNFSSATADIQSLYPTGQLLDITYYKNLADALAEQNAITNTSNYSNFGYPNTQNIYVRVDSQLDNECLGLGHHITLRVEPIPIVQPMVIKHCDDNQDGIFGFDTTNLQSTLLNSLTNVTVSYTDQNGNPLTSPLPNPFVTASQTITVNVKNNYGKQCDYNTTIQLIVDDLPQAFAISSSLTTVCDDETNPALQNGSYPFNTATFQSAILGSQTGMIVKYYDANNNPLPSPLPNPYITTQHNINVEVINPINTSCKATMTIPLVVYPVPNINLLGNELICSDNPNFTKIIDAGLVDTSTINNYTYTWFLDNSLIPNQNQYSLIINTEGIYTVEVKNAQGCSRTRTITVTASNIAIIDSVVVNDLVGVNSIMVLLAASSIGDYVYSLDNSNYQTSNIFSNVIPGIYTVYVKDLKGCGITPKEVSVLGIPKYFTPNGDGYNDYWNIDGVNQNFYAKSTIHIFDRYGKLLKQISSTGQGWDGTFNSQNVPSDDYWYVIKLDDTRIVKGHFALKR